MTSAVNDFVFLRDQQRLSDEELALARRVCGYIRAVIESRATYIEAHNLDPDISLPQANWSANSPIYDGYRQVASGDTEILQNLRLFSQMFTGYRLCDLKDARGTYIPNGVPANLDATLEQLSRAKDPWVKRYTRAIGHLPSFLRLGPPAKFGEIGWVVDGVTVTCDTYVYLERLALLYEAGLIAPDGPASICRRTPLTILEIGGGYGGLAYYLRRIVPHARYVIVDLPESLIFSAVYLSVLFPHLQNHCIGTTTPASDLLSTEPGWTFVPNYLFSRLSSAGFRADLVINTLSMSEMSEKQVRSYCEGVREMLGRTGLFFEQNQDNRSVGLLNAMDLIADYFANCMDLTGEILGGLTQGKAHVWSN